jgi:tRNA/tmRNA/rRNA uracil-C5-methylase (TrmA/RlmC/RlmD family)
MTALQPGQVLDVTANELVAGGDALVRVDGFPIFVGGIYPGDRARIEITDVRRGFARAAVSELLSSGPLRRVEPCSIADRCGGCDWTSLRLDAQLAAKEQILRDSLRRIGKLEENLLPAIAIHPSPLNYRLRSRLHVSQDGKRAGFYEAGTNEVVPLAADCEVVGPELLRRVGELPAAAAPGSSVVAIEQRSRFTVEPAESAGSRFRIDVGRYRYALSTGSFFQVNRHLLATLIGLVRGIGARVPVRNIAFDLYGGVGFFALPLSELFGMVSTVESSKESSRYAERNCRGVGERIRVVHDDVLRFLRRSTERADLIMIDPPRAGLEPEVTEAVAENCGNMICYLSCDPVTFSRDAARLVRRGWRLASLDLLDLFPNTHHIETLSSFERAT